MTKKKKKTVKKIVKLHSKQIDYEFVILQKYQFQSTKKINKL